MSTKDFSSSSANMRRLGMSENGSIFPEGSVVQLIGGHPEGDDAHVITMRPATVVVGVDRIIASTDSSELSWLFSDIERVFYGGDEPWTIFEVPDVPDMGVSVRVGDLDAFRVLIEKMLPGTTHVQRRSSMPSSEELVDVVLQSNSPSPSWFESLAPDEPEELAASASELSEQQPATPVAAIDDTVVIPVNSTVIIPVAPFDTGNTLVGIEARAISAWFGSHQVLDRVSLDMPAGLVTALIGPSGCGKSTFLRILNRMHEMIPSASLAGEVLLDGVDIYDPSRRLTDARRQIGMVFQKPNPFPAMSIYDNVVAGFRLTGTKHSSSVKDQVVESCLSKAGLWNEVRDRLRQPGGSLSGGQQQRLCIARALAIKPRVLLMDEPCSALDPTSTRRIEQTITELAEDVTIVIVTHNMQQAVRVSHRCAFFLAEQGTPGVIVEYGPTEAMFHNPQDQRTNDYVNGRFG